MKVFIRVLVANGLVVAVMAILVLVPFRFVSMNVRSTLASCLTFVTLPLVVEIFFYVVYSIVSRFRRGMARR